MRSNSRYAALVPLLLALISFALVLFTKSAGADEYHLIDLQELSLDYKNYAMLNDKARNLLIYPEHPKEGINLIIDTDFLQYFYWNSTIESLTTSSQYRGIGLETRLGIYLSDHINLGLWHHSQHTLDRAPANVERYPSEDAVELKLILYRAKPGKGLL